MTHDIFEIPESALEVASAQGQLEVVQTLLDDGAHPDYSHWFESTTPLIAAARAGHLEIARALLQAGADVSISKDCGQISAIEAAAEVSDIAMLELLLEAVTNSATGFDQSDHEDVMSAQDTQKDSTGQSEKSEFLKRARESFDAALVVAGEAGNMLILQRLLDAGADVNAHRAIATAAAAGHVEVMIKLIQTATDQQNLPRESITRALQCAADAGHVLVVQPLLQAGADAAKIDIIKAAAKGHLDILTSLVQSAADDETVLSCYRSVEALHLATRNGHKAIVDLLLAIGTDVNAVTMESRATAVSLAVAGGHTAIVKRLIDAGADLNAPPKCSWDQKYADTALQAAARAGSMATLELLLAAGAQVDTEDKKHYWWKNTALSVAAECDKPEIVARLLSLMSPDDARRSAPAAVERAIENHHTRIVRQLLELQIDVDIYGPWRRTLLQAAAKNGNFESLKILVAHKADVNLNPRWFHSNNPLQHAARRGSLDAVKLLLAAGAEINVVGAKAPPILLAAENGHIPVFDHLLAVGADITLTAYRGRTITQAARASGNTEMMERVQAALESCPPIPKEPQPPTRGTGPLCAACQEPGFLADLFEGYHKRKTLHPSLKSLRDSACAGCPFCCFLWRQLGITSITLPQPSKVRLFTGHNRGQLTCQINEPFPIDVEDPEMLLVHFPYTTEPFQGEISRSVKHTGLKLDINDGLEYRNPITEDTSSPETYRQMEAWLETCDKGHLKCQVATESPYVPTRLIHLDSSTDLVGDNLLGSSFLPRLISTKGTSMEFSNTQYMVLSYRWPEDFPNEPKSTRETILNHMQGLDVSKLPQVFNDFFQIAARLRVEYVWINSLCIIQDDQEDWNREAAQMSQIYQNAYLTVAMAVPQMPGKGLFRRGEPPETLAQRILCPLEDGSSREVVFMKSQAERYKDSPLNSRGWCFQEREMSRRVVHYTESQVLWECRTLQASEGLPKGSTSLESLVTYRWDKRMLDKDLGGGEVNNAWRRAVEDYSSRNLTKATDKLPALAGLAAAMRDRKLKTCRYLAGLWEDDILCGLAWVPRHEGYTDKSIGRYSDYIAPTWSWASVTGPVSYDSNIERRVTAFHFAPERKETAYDYAPQVLDICVQTTTADPFGAVRHAALRLSARLLPAVLSKERRYRSSKGGLTGCMNEEVRLKTESGENIGGMNFDVLKEEHDGEGIASIFCVCLGVLTSRGLHISPAGPALAVVPTLIRNNEYRRVGIIPEMKISDFNSVGFEDITIV